MTSARLPHALTLLAPPNWPQEFFWPKDRKQSVEPAGGDEATAGDGGGGEPAPASAPGVRRRAAAAAVPG